MRQGDDDMRIEQRDDLAPHLERIEADGYTIIEDAIEPDLVVELRDTVRRVER